MNIKEVKSKKLYKEYSLVIPFEDVELEINKKVTDLKPSVSIPGFRKGKVPENIIRKKYEESILNDVVQNVVNLKISELIKEKKFNLFRQPKVDLKKFEKNKPITVELKLDLQPDIKLQDFKKVKLNKYEINLSSKDVDNHYKKFLKSQKSFKKINNSREIIIKDRVTINFETSNLDVPEYLKSQKNIPIDTGENQEILPGINKILTTKKLKLNDKKNFFFDLSKLLKNEKLKRVEYNIEIISIEENTKFEITDDFLSSNGFKDEKELRSFLKTNSMQQYNQGIKQIEKKQLMDLLNNDYNFDLPDGIVEEDFSEIWHRLEHAKKEDKLDEDDKLLSEEKLKERYKKISLRRVKLGVLLQFIAKEEKIEITQDELSKGLMQYASQYPGQEKQILDYLKKNPSSVESIRGPILEDKIISTISSKATITNKKINEEQYKKLEEVTFDIKKEKI